MCLRSVIKAFQFIMEMFFKLKNHQFIPVTNLLSQKQCEVLDLAHDLIKLSQYEMALQLLRKNKVLVDVAMENSMYDCNESCEKIIDGVLQNVSYSKEPVLVPKGAVSVACPKVLCNHQVHLNLRLTIVNNFDEKHNCRMHATSLSSNDRVHSKPAHQETKCQKQMKYDGKRWLSFVGYFLNHCDKPPPCNEKAMLKYHCDRPPPKKNDIKRFVRYIFCELKIFFVEFDTF